MALSDIRQKRAEILALMQELEDLLGCRVDVVAEDVLHRSIRSRVLAEGVSL